MANLLGSLSLAVHDRVHSVTEAAAGHIRVRRRSPALSTQLEGKPIDALARSLGITHSATVRLIDRLEQAGLVERGREADTRSVSVLLTHQGRESGRQVLAARQQAMDEVLAILNPAERRTLAHICEKLLDGLTLAARTRAGYAGSATPKLAVTTAAAARLPRLPTGPQIRQRSSDEGPNVDLGGGTGLVGWLAC